jgi:hypothetical protein
LRKIRIANPHFAGEGHKLAAHPDAAQIPPPADFRLAGGPVAAKAHKQRHDGTKGNGLHINMVCEECVFRVPDVCKDFTSWNQPGDLCLVHGAN